MEEQQHLDCALYSVEDTRFLLNNGPDLISRQLRSGKMWESFTLKVSKLLLENVENPVLIDIGANLGAWSVPMGKHIAACHGKLYAFEPQRSVFYQLCGNFFANHLFHCHAQNIAIADYNGTVNVPVLDMLNEKNIGALSLDANIRQQQRNLSTLTDKSECVPVATLDSLDLPVANLIKIDVEGLELEVLSGGKNWLAKSGFPPILFEVWGDYMHGMIEKKQRLLKMMQSELGYEIFLYGELCIAQQPDKKRINIICNDNFVKIEKLFYWAWG